MQRLSIWAACLVFLVPGALIADTVVYDFSESGFTGITPFVDVSPNTGPSGFLATFTANISNYSTTTQEFTPDFEGWILKSGCFCAQTLTAQFNTLVNAVFLDFTAIGSGFELTLTTDVGIASATSLSLASGGRISFASDTPFDHIVLGTGVFAIDNLRLETVPEPSSLVLLIAGLLSLGLASRPGFDRPV